MRPVQRMPGAEAVVKDSMHWQAYVTIYGLGAAHSNIRDEIPSFASQKSPILQGKAFTPESCFRGMRSKCAFLAREKQRFTFAENLK